MRLAVLLAAAALLVASAPLALAAERCVPVTADRVVPSDAVPGLPEGWVPLLALDESRLPPVPSVAASGPGGVCDLTGGLGAFARAAGLRDPAQLATLAVAASFPDQLGVPEVRSLVLDGGVARVATWSARDGVVADWVVDLASLRADFVVRAVGVGPYVVGEEGFEGWHVWPGFSSQLLRDLEAGLLATKVKLQPLPDGNQFRLTYFTQFYASEAEADAYAQAYADASLAVWRIQNQDWGFTSADPDGTYDIRMDGCSCISGGNNVNIRVHAKLEDLIRLLNLQYPSFAHFYRIVIGHEWHHHLQYSINGWAMGGVLTEGGARFSETIFEPEGAHGPRTIQTLPNLNGFSNVMLNPNRMFTQRLYDFGLFWGYLYSVDGGLRMLKAVYAGADDVQGNANEVLPHVVNTALLQLNQEAPGSTMHLTFLDAYADFAGAMARRSFPWTSPGSTEVRDWGLYLPEARRTAASAAGPAHVAESGVVLGGIVLLGFPGGAGAAGAGAASPLLAGKWHTKASGAWATSPLPALAVAVPYQEAVFGAVNGGLPFSTRRLSGDEGVATAALAVAALP